MQHNKKQNTARLLALLLTTVMFFGVLAFAVPTVSAAEGGSCGAELTWSYNAGTLTISGKGDMTNFREPDMAPWYHLRDSILRVNLPAELTSIGSLAFYSCKNLTTITIPDYVRTIGEYSFTSCTNLRIVKFGVRVETIDDAAFYGCESLDSVRLPQGLSKIGYQAFYRCSSLTSISIPFNLSELGTSAFAYCTSLIRAEISARLSAVPEWTFYGCDALNLIVLPETINSIENYAFKNCEQLSTVYFGGDKTKKDNIEYAISEDVPAFAVAGVVSDSPPPTTVIGGKYTDNGDGTGTQVNTTVNQKETVTVVSKVEHTHPETSNQSGSYKADVTVTVENKEGWQEATDAVKETLEDINDRFSNGNIDKEKIDVTVYVKEETPVAEDFVKEMAGREVEMTVVTQNGSTYRVDCSDVKREELSGSYNYSYNVTESTEEINTKLGTENCYQVSFTESAQINAEVLVKLPEDAKNSNAFLYQIEDNGEYTRLQAVAIDNDNNAHFYLASVDKDTQYVIGVDVPGEKTDDVIIPDELFSQYGNAVERLERIEYVITGRQSSWGLNMMQVTWILLAVLVVCIVIVGVVMTIIHKKRLISGYYEKKMLLYEEGEDFDDDEDEDEDEEE